MAERAPVQGSSQFGIAPGTIEWSEHLKAWEVYAELYGSYQSAEDIAKRGGFDVFELTIFLKGTPRTWKPRR